MEWKEIQLRPLTDEEKSEGVDHDAIWEGDMPEDDEEVLVSGVMTVYTDVWVRYDDNSVGFENTENVVWDIVHWMPFPKPYEKEEF